MEAKIKNRPNVTGTEAKGNSANAAEVKTNGAMTKALPVAKPEEKKIDEPENVAKPEQAKVDRKPESNQPEKAGEHPQAATPQEAKAIVPALNLEATLKVVQDLHRRSIQRDNLLNRIGQLEAFEISLIEGGDELESNHFQGCKLTITDDKGKQFTTNTAGLIRMVSQFIYDACIEKLQDIESNIVFPRA